METLTPPSTCRHASLQLTTCRPTEFIDVTDRLEWLAAASGVRSGVLNVQTLHTTTAVIVNEHEPLLLADFQAMLEAAAPGDARYRHDDMDARRIGDRRERVNGHAHCRALLLPCSVSLNVTGGGLRLGRWQRVFFVELDGPQARELSVMVVGDTGPS